MTTNHKVSLSVIVRPVYHKDPPEILIGINDETTKVVLTDVTKFDLNFETSLEQCQLNIEFLNKKDSDTVPDKNLDKAVVIESVSFFDINDPKFAWAGVYQPKYPKKWAKEQKKAGVVLEQQLKAHTYLGWNGKWTLTFDIPVFTWVHKVQNLGWIYD